MVEHVWEKTSSNIINRAKHNNFQLSDTGALPASIDKQHQRQSQQNCKSSFIVTQNWVFASENKTRTQVLEILELWHIWQMLAIFATYGNFWEWKCYRVKVWTVNVNVYVCKNVKESKCDSLKVCENVNKLTVKLTCPTILPLENL